MINAEQEQLAEHISPVPILFGEDWQYLKIENRYMRAKASGDWAQGKWKSALAKRKPLAFASILAYGKDLVDLISYLEVRKTSWDKGNAAFLLDDYHQDSLSGAWRLAGAIVSRKTCDRRQGTGADLLSFAVAVGEIELPADGPKLFERSKRPKLGRRGPRVQGIAGSRRGIRKGPVRISPDDLEVPTASEVEGWLDRASSKCRTLGAMCRAVVDVGFRRQEACLFRVEDLPAQASSTGEETELKITWGAKGSRRPDDPEKKGKARKAVVSAEAIARLIAYRDNVRPKAVKVFQSLNPGKPIPKQLFLHPRTGKAISEHQLYRAWSAARGSGAVGPGWSTHMGRHVYALRTALRALREEAEAYQSKAVDPRRLHSILTIVVQPSLGHEDYDTTKRYLKWLKQAFRKGGIAAACERYLGT